MNRKKQIVAVALALLLLSVFILLTSRSGSLNTAQLGGVSVTFQGVTTNSLVGSIAVFRLHNSHRKPIKYVVGPPQVQRLGQWPERLQTMRNVTEVIVQPGQKADFSVPVPSDTEPWRVPVAYYWAPSLYQRSVPGLFAGSATPFSRQSSRAGRALAYCFHSDCDARGGWLLSCRSGTTS